MANSNDNTYCYPCLHWGKDQCQVMVIGYDDGYDGGDGKGYGGCDSSRFR